tara:strand:- start:1476 stop:1637 length:162 start_codon:yes stop_codon:yes gene_type:complete
MKIVKKNKDYILTHKDTNLRIFAQGDSVYLKDDKKNRLFGMINGSAGTIVNWD